MSTSERDPFELLPRFVDPEPDPVVMRAVIAQSRAAFAQRQSHPAGESRNWLGGLRHRLSALPNWLAPAGIGAFGVVIALMAVPGLMLAPPGDRAVEQVVAEAPAAQPPVAREPGSAVVLDQPSQSGGSIRMGARPLPGAQPLASAPAPLSIVAGDGVRLGYRATPTEMLIYRFDGADEQLVDSQPLVPGEQSDVRGAFVVTPPRQKEILAVQLRIDGAMFWRAYGRIDGAYARDLELSARLSDAPDQAEAERRLATH